MDINNPRWSTAGSASGMYTAAPASEEDGELEGKEWAGAVSGDPQGRSAARMAERRGKEGVPVGFAGGMTPDRGRRGWKRWWILGLGLLAVVALAVGLGVGLTVGRNSGKSNTLASGSNGTTTLGGNSTAFSKDPRLHNSFHAFAYTPQNVLLPA